MKSLGFIAKVVVSGVVVALGLLTLQPWLSVSASLAQEIRIIPFLEFFVAIPWIGGWILAISTALGHIIGVLLWGFVQLTQIIPLLFELRLNGGIPQGWRDKTDFIRWIAYGIEAFVCFLQFPPYTGGIDAFMLDAPYWDIALIDWWQLAIFLLSITAFEALVALGAFLFAIIDASNRRAKKKSKPKKAPKAQPEQPKEAPANG